MNKETINRLRMIIAFVFRHNLGDIYAAFSPENNLCATVLFLKSNRKVNLLFSSVSKEGIDLNAMELLLDHYIKKNAERNLTLNFENLAIPDKEAFCSGFGANSYHFTTVKSPNHAILRKLFV
jgi:catalase